MNRLRAVALTMCALLCLQVSPDVLAWGRDGHAVVAAIAYSRLTPEARAAADALIQSVLPGQTFVSVASWADDNRTQETAPWHFVDMPGDDCNFTPPRDCKDGECIVGAINAESRVLGDPSQSQQSRAYALLYLIHLAGGDTGQPLHAYGPYRGGNDYPVELRWSVDPNKPGKRTELHKVWDDDMVLAAADDEFQKHRLSMFERSSAQRDDDALNALVQELAKEARAVAPQTNLSPVPWVEESCRIAASPGFFPRNGVVDRQYLTSWAPVAERQLLVGGIHLADTLNLFLKGP
jgi:nuclease S1